MDGIISGINEFINRMLLIWLIKPSADTCVGTIMMTIIKVNAAFLNLKSYAWIAYAVSAEKYTESTAEPEATRRLLHIPFKTGSCLSFNRFVRLTKNDFPGIKENPFCIAGWDLVVLISST